MHLEQTYQHYWLPQALSAFSKANLILNAHLPARSTRLSAPRRVVAEAACRPVMLSMKTEWERDDTAFMAVASHARACAALRTRAAAASVVVMRTVVAPATCVWPPGATGTYQVVVIWIIMLLKSRRGQAWQMQASEDAFAGN